MEFKNRIIRALGGDVKPNSGKAINGTVQNSRVPTSPTNPNNVWRRPDFDAAASKLFDDTSLTREEIYTGIVYRAMTTIANRTAQVILNNTIVRDNNGEEMDKEEHPYWTLIDESKTFTNFEFFYGIATYLQLGGFAPILAVRNFTERNGKVSTVGDIKEFQIVSPYQLTMLLSDEDDKLLGYEQKITLHNGATKTRELGVPHIIPVKLFNPFDNLLGFGVARAANDYQFTAREAGKYTRRSMKNNISASGIITINKVLDGPMREQFKQEMRARYASVAADGSPIIAFGSDSMNWQDLRQDMDKMALEKIHDMNMEDLLTVLGVSKTVMGIEQSGVTRETSKVQQDLLLMNIVMPLAQAILDEFNQDYRNYYPVQWAKNKLTFTLDSPLSKDYEAEKIEAEAINTKMDAAKKMWDMGASRESIVDALGLPEEIEFEGEPRWTGGNNGTENPIEQLAGAGATGTTLSDEETLEEEEAAQQSAKVISPHEIPTTKNALSMEQVVEIKRMREEVYLKVSENELSVVDAYIESMGDDLQKNQTLPDSQREVYVNELRTILTDYYYAVVPILGQAVSDFRRQQYGMVTEFELNDPIRQMIRRRVSKTSAAHFDYIDNTMTNLLKKAVDGGWSRDRMVREIQRTFNQEIATSDAKRLAVTETNNAFNKSQFWADRQFIEQNNLEGRAYKQWVTYSPDPCPHCIALSQQSPIPFDKPFINVGDSFGAEFEHKDGTKVVRYITPNSEFGPVEDGNAHPNCACKYRLVLKFN